MPLAERNNAEKDAERARPWGYIAAVVAGIALVLVFLLWFGIPRSLESFAHRNDRTWQERNNPTTTTTLYVAPPLDDAFAASFQSQLNHAVNTLQNWNYTWGTQWETLSLDMQYAWDPYAVDPDTFGNAYPSVTECVERFVELSKLWKSLYRGDLIDFDEIEVWSESQLSDQGAKHWDRVGDDANNLVQAMTRELRGIDRILLWTATMKEYRVTTADMLYVRSWENTREKVDSALYSAGRSLDGAYTSWYLATDKAERPWRY